jgi:hypothetical protein
MKGCNDSKALQVYYPGTCSATPPVTVLKEWPKSLDNLPFVTQLFIRVAVVFLSLSVPDNAASNYTSDYFSDKLSDILGYQVVVPEIFTPARTRRVVNKQLTLNVTLYAHYPINNNNAILVRNTQLLADIQKHQTTIEMNLNVQNLSASLSYGAQPILVSNTSVYSSTTTRTSVSSAQPAITTTMSSLFQSLTLTSSATVTSSQILITQLLSSRPSTSLMSSPGATTNILSSAEQSLFTISASQTLPLSPSTILASSTEATTPSAVIQSTASALTGQILFSGEKD